MFKKSLSLLRTALCNNGNSPHLYGMFPRICTVYIDRYVKVSSFHSSSKFNTLGKDQNLDHTHRQSVTSCRMPTFRNRICLCNSEITTGSICNHFKSISVRGLSMRMDALTTHMYHTTTYMHKSSRKSGKGTTMDIDTDDDSDDSDDENDGTFDHHFSEDDMFPDEFKEIKRVLKSSRADAVLSFGLNISRKKLDDYFLGSKLRLNGQKMLKFGKQLQTGDYIDLLEREGGKTAVKRVRVVKVNTILRKNKEKREVYVRAWRGMNFLPIYD